MVRLEKIAYERVLNSKALGRARNITSPKKTDFFSEIYLRRTPSSRLVNSITAPIKGLTATSSTSRRSTATRGRLPAPSSTSTGRAASSIC